MFRRTPSVRISRRINVPKPSISESTGVLNLPTPNGQASGNISPNSEAAELKKFETLTFPPSPPPDEAITSFSSDTVDAGSPSIVNHVGHDSGPAKEVRMPFSFMFDGCFRGTIKLLTVCLCSGNISTDRKIGTRRTGSRRE